MENDKDIINSDAFVATFHKSIGLVLQLTHLEDYSPKKKTESYQTTRNLSLLARGKTRGSIIMAVKQAHLIRRNDEKKNINLSSFFSFLFLF